MSDCPAAGSSRPSMHCTTLKELAAASPRKPTASLEQQLAELQRDLKAKQAEVEAGKADLEHRQRLLRFAAGLPCSTQSRYCVLSGVCMIRHA